MTSNQQLILLAEDDSDDVFFLRRALSKAGINSPLHVVDDGQKALDYLSGLGKFSDRLEFPLPSLVLLDLKMPLVNGFTVLAWLRSQPSLASIPVFILTSSGEDSDQDQARHLGADGYFVKPPTRELLTRIAALLGEHRETAAMPGIS